MIFPIRFSASVLRPIFKLLDFLTPIADLLARIWVAKSFFSLGFPKLKIGKPP